MDFTMAQALFAYPISLSMEPLPTLPGIDSKVLRQNMVRHHPSVIPASLATCPLSGLRPSK